MQIAVIMFRFDLRNKRPKVVHLMTRERLMALNSAESAAWPS
jgi:hypothetical protein